MTARSSLFLVVLLLFSTSASAQWLPPNSVWKNQFESTLTVLSVEPDGKFRGVYVNGNRNYACPGQLAFPAAGIVRGNRVHFVVTWKTKNRDCKTVTSWSGSLFFGTLNADYVLAYMTPAGAWLTDAGLDYYYRVR